jgi:hypothetical protein
MRSRAADKLAASPKRECPICGKEIHTDAASCHHCEEHPGDLANPPKVTNGETSDMSSGLQTAIKENHPHEEGDKKTLASHRRRNQPLPMRICLGFRCLF